MMDLNAFSRCAQEMKFRGCKGTTGTQGNFLFLFLVASFMALFGGNHDVVKALDEKVTRAMGFSSAFKVCGQTYSRKVDLDILSGIFFNCV